MCQVALVLLNEALLTLQPCHSLPEKRTSKCVSAFVSSGRHLSSPGCENLNKAWHEGALGRLQLPVYHSGEVSWPFSNMKCLKMDLWLCFQTEMESGDSPCLVEPRGNLKGLCSGSTFRSPPPLSQQQLCFVNLPATEPHQSLDKLPVSWAVPSLPRLHHRLPAPQAGEAPPSCAPAMALAQALLAWMQPASSSLHSSTACDCVVKRRSSALCLTHE